MVKKSKGAKTKVTKIEESNDILLGDVVTLISGSPDMTVGRFENYTQEDGSCYTEVVVYWFGEGIFQTAKIDLGALQLAK